MPGSFSSFRSQVPCRLTAPSNQSSPTYRSLCPWAPWLLLRRVHVLTRQLLTCSLFTFPPFYKVFRNGTCSLAHRRVQRLVRRLSCGGRSDEVRRQSCICLQGRETGMVEVVCELGWEGQKGSQWRGELVQWRASPEEGVCWRSRDGPIWRHPVECLVQGF